MDSLNQAVERAIRTSLANYRFERDKILAHKTELQNSKTELQDKLAAINALIVADNADIALYNSLIDGLRAEADAWQQKGT